MVLNAANSGVSGSTLTLNFTEVSPSGEQMGVIPAGTPFIIKWNNMGTTIEEPEFTGVTISNATANNEQAFTGGSFKGSFSPVSFTANDKSILFLGAENKLYWPNADMTLGACRAYFKLGTTNASKFVMNFEDDATSIRSLSPAPSPSREGSEYWYDMSGRKLSQQPTQKGVYIHGGRKVVIK